MPNDPSDRRAVAVLLAAWTLLVLLSLATRSFAPIDETRYVSVAWHMWRRGDFLVPWLAGEPYSHKPPLLFWLMHAGWAVFGVDAWWPRLLSPLAALAALALTARLARRLWPDDPRVGARAAAVLAGSLLWILFTTSTMFDVVLTVFVLLGVSGLLEAARGHPARGWAGVALAIGGGLLTKGPIVLLHLLPLAVLAPLWARDVSAPWPRRHWWGGLVAAVAAGALIALAWAIPAGLRGGEAYRDAILWGQTAGRVVHAFDHARPWWWYLPLLPLLAFPWALWPRAWRALSGLRRRSGDGGVRFALAWGAPVFATLCLISGKQVHYLLPLFPAGALLLARALPAAGPVGRWGAWPVALALAALGLVLLAHPVWIARAGGADWTADFPPWVGLLPLAAAAVVLALPASSLPERPPWRLAGTTLIVVAGVQAAFFVTAGLAYDAREIGRRLGALQRAGVPLALAGKEDHGSFDFAGRLVQPLQEVAERDLGAWFAAHRDGVAVWRVRRDVYDERLPADYRQHWRGQYIVMLRADAYAVWAQALAGQGTRWPGDRAAPPGVAGATAP